MFKFASLDINSVYSSLIAGQFGYILHTERVGINSNDVRNANSNCPLSFTASTSSSLLKVFNALRPNSDLSQTSYYNIKGLSVSEVMRIKNTIIQVQFY